MAMKRDPQLSSSSNLASMLQLDLDDDDTFEIEHTPYDEIQSSSEYIPYDEIISPFAVNEKKTCTLPVHEKCECTIRTKKMKCRPEVQIHTGLAVSLISLKLAEELKAKIEYTEYLIPSYLMEQPFTTAVGKCVLTIHLQGTIYKDSTFYVMKEDTMSVVLGNNTLNRVPKYVLDVQGPLPPIEAFGNNKKVTLENVAVDQFYKIDSVRLDTGCEVNIISRGTADALGAKLESSHTYMKHPLSNTSLQLKQYCFCDIVHDQREYRSVKFYVVDEMSEDMMLGMNFVFNHQQVVITYDRYSKSSHQLLLDIKHPEE